MLSETTGIGSGGIDSSSLDASAADSDGTGDPECPLVSNRSQRTSQSFASNIGASRFFSTPRSSLPPPPLVEEGEQNDLETVGVEKPLEARKRHPSFGSVRFLQRTPSPFFPSLAHEAAKGYSQLSLEEQIICERDEADENETDEKTETVIKMEITGASNESVGMEKRPSDIQTSRFGISGPRRRQTEAS